jgi:hypothetical protein
MGATPPGGASSRAMGCCGALGPTTYSTSSLSFLFLEQTSFLAQTRVLAAQDSDFLISLVSPSLLLKFGAFVLRYVTPPLVQVEFHLVKYLLSILEQ